MKKILAVLFSLFLITPASADVLLNLSGDKWGPSITSHFSGDNAVNAAAKVRDLLQASPAGISAKDVWDICVAGGLNIAEGSGKNQCLSFLQSLLVFGDSNYIRVCVPGELSKIKDENIRTISKCEKDFFNYTNVQMIQAVELAKLYAKKKWGDDGVVCSNTYNKAENDYWLSCKSTKTGAFYEFKFDDVKESDYYYDAARWAYEKGMVTGSKFEGDTPCTRSATVVYLWKNAGSPYTSYYGSFADVTAGSGFASAVAWAVENGVTSGTSETTFSPDMTCTRGQIVTFLKRALR